MLSGTDEHLEDALTALREILARDGVLAQVLIAFRAHCLIWSRLAV